jgi:DNA-binding NarL/FixJ family response regulator
MGTGESRIVLLDRHPMWLDCIRSVLERAEMDVVAATTTPAEALEAIAEQMPRLFVLDPAGRDGTDGMELIERALAIAPELKVVAMSAVAESHVIDAAFAAGASAYVVKTASESDIAAALRLAVTTAIYIARATTRVPDSPVGEGALTRREFEILALVAEGQPNAAIGRKLWVTEQTVKFHLSNVYRKIGVQNRTAAARWAELHGVSPIATADDGAEQVTAGSAA